MVANSKYNPLCNGAVDETNDMEILFFSKLRVGVERVELYRLAQLDLFRLEFFEIY